MRIALLSPLPPERNGIADYAQHFWQALERNNVEIVLPLKGLRLSSRKEAAQWARDFAWKSVDSVHAQIGGGLVSEFLALEALADARPARGGPSLTATVHDPERMVWQPMHDAWRWLEKRRHVPKLMKQCLAVVNDPLTLRAERRLAGRLDGIVTLTETGAASLSRRLRVPRASIAVISHGTPEIAAAELPPLQPLRLLYFGFIYRGKGIEDLLDALARVMDVLPGARQYLRLTLAGGSTPSMAYGSTGSYIGELRDRVRRLGLEDLVDWTLDVPDDGIAPLIQRHHAVLLPYRESRKLALLGKIRGTSGALAWTVACGRGAITSNARSFAEEIDSGNGLSYRQGDVDELAQCIAALVRVPAMAQQWADAASRLAVGRGWNHTAQKFIQCFDRWEKSRT